MRRVAIIGAGFSGLGLCVHLLKRGGIEVTVFDPKGVGGGASGIASGLLHPYPGESARLSWRGKEAMQAATALVEESSQALGKKVADRAGILRIALTEKQEKAFQERAEVEEDVEWWSAEKCRSAVSGAHFCPGIFIRSGQTVHPKLYLEGLWNVCSTLGATLEKREVELSELTDYDQVVIAAGSGIRKFKECQNLAVKFNKGQLLACKKPAHLRHGFSVIGKGYLALSESQERCYLGSTYEHTFRTEDPCMGEATDQIFSRIGTFLPSYGSFEVEDCLSGMRVSNQKTYLPLAGRLKENLWAFTAMGSRGLLYHSFLGKKLAEALDACDESLIPEEVRL